MTNLALSSPLHRKALLLLLRKAVVISRPLLLIFPPGRLLLRQIRIRCFLAPVPKALSILRLRIWASPKSCTMRRVALHWNGSKSISRKARILRTCNSATSAWTVLCLSVSRMVPWRRANTLLLPMMYLCSSRLIRTCQLAVKFMARGIRIPRRMLWQSLWTKAMSSKSSSRVKATWVPLSVTCRLGRVLPMAMAVRLCIVDPVTKRTRTLGALALLKMATRALVMIRFSMQLRFAWTKSSRMFLMKLKAGLNFTTTVPLLSILRVGNLNPSLKAKSGLSVAPIRLFRPMAICSSTLLPMSLVKVFTWAKMVMKFICTKL